MTRLSTPLTELVGIEHPVVQTGMGWVAGPRLVAATANAGGLGILASATMTLEQLAAAIAEVKDRTDRPFGVNLRADAEDANERVQLLIRERVRVASAARTPRSARKGSCGWRACCVRAETRAPIGTNRQACRCSTPCSKMVVRT